MADAVYRAAFIRMHPTGKVVLSLSEAAKSKKKTEELAALVAGELGIPPEDVKVVHEDDDRFGEGNSFNSEPSDEVGDAVAATARKLRDKARIVAGAMLEATPDSLRYDNGHWAVPGGDPEGVRIQAVAARAFGGFEMPDGLDGSLDAQTTYRLGAAEPAA
jgi:aerobic carbon-monoxide dehydrogenase large subunit